MLGEAREVEARRAAFLERQARLEKAARLAPQLGVRAKPAERGEELRIAAALEQPALRGLDSKQRLGQAVGSLRVLGQLAVERHERRRPFLLQSAFDDP